MSVHQCGCERGGLCTTITECYADQVLRDETERLERELAEAREERDTAEGALLRHGYRKTCDIPACNCGSQWNHGGHAAARLTELSEVLYENGKTLLQSANRLVEERNALHAELARVNESFQGETLRNSRLTQLLAAWMQQHELEHEPGRWSKACSTCALVLRSRVLLKDTIFAGALEKELRAARQPEQPQSEDDKALTALVDEFAAEMKLKLLAKRREGNWGWDNPENRDKIEHGLFAHLKRPGQWIDVANYAAFLWNIDRQPEQGDPI